jgi:tetrahydromethanopterin S-methyltransferase subunit G
MNKYLFSFLLCLNVLLFSGYTSSAEIAVDSAVSVSETKQVRNITYEEWHDLTNDDDFRYKDKVENQKIKQPTNNAFTKFFDAIGKWMGSPLGKFIVWGLLILVILYAVYKVVLGERSSIFGKRSKVQDDGDIHAVVEDINETDWEKLLHKSAKEGDLRLSVRYSYMLLLRLLQDSGLILYREDKTNYQYASELADTQYKQPFRQLSRQYEYTWYGNFPISETSYEEYVSTIMDLKKKLGR